MLTPFRNSVIAQKANDLRQFTYIFIFDNPTLCEQFVFQLFHLLLMMNTLLIQMYSSSYFTFIFKARWH